MTDEPYTIGDLRGLLGYEEESIMEAPMYRADAIRAFLNGHSDIATLLALLSISCAIEDFGADIYKKLDQIFPEVKLGQ